MSKSSATHTHRTIRAPLKPSPQFNVWRWISIITMHANRIYQKFAERLFASQPNKRCLSAFNLSVAATCRAIASSLSNRRAMPCIYIRNEWMKWVCSNSSSWMCCTEWSVEWREMYDGDDDAMPILRHRYRSFTLLLTLRYELLMLQIAGIVDFNCVCGSLLEWN